MSYLFCVVRSVGANQRGALVPAVCISLPLVELFVRFVRSFVYVGVFVLLLERRRSNTRPATY